jgi:single-stranded-DNA-specific exonuclease
MVAPVPDASQAEALARSLSIPTPLAALLLQRGHDTPEAARLFLRPSLDQLTDPMALSGMTEAVDVIAETIAALPRS